VDGAGIVLALESRSCEALAAACERLKQLLPAGAVISEQRDCTAINLSSPDAGAPGGKATPAAAAAAAAAAAPCNGKQAAASGQ